MDKKTRIAKMMELFDEARRELMLLAEDQKQIDHVKNARKSLRRAANLAVPDFGLMQKIEMVLIELSGIENYINGRRG